MGSQLQLELFEAPGAGHPVPRSGVAAGRHVEGLRCLREAVPEALEVVVELRNPSPRDSRSPCASGDWAYCVSDAGVYFQRASEWWTWGAWSRRPAHLLPWDELRGLVGDDPRRSEVAAWVGSVPLPRWRIVMRPFELWPDPESWGPRNLAYDRERDGAQWPARRRAWGLVLDLLDDAIAAAGAVEAR